MLYEFDTHLTDQATSHHLIASEVDDNLLLKHIAAGDEAALTMCFSRYEKLLRSVILRVIDKDADADEVLQEVMLEVWNRASSFDPQKGKPLGWLIIIARRRAIDRVRRRRSYSGAMDRFQAHVEERPETVSSAEVDELAAKSDALQKLKVLLLALPAAQQQAIELAFFQGLTQREIAAKIRVPLGTLKTRLELGIRKLRLAVGALGTAEDWGIFVHHGC